MINDSSLNLLHPSFLWALLLLVIPIIVHLFNLRRYKKEYFTNTNLLKTLLEETKKTSKLKKRLLLLSRLLAMIFIILGFAQPYFNDASSKEARGQPILSIYIDNSFSMEAPTGQLKAIDEAKQKAKEIIKSVGTDGLFQILTNNFKSNELQLVSYQEAKDIIQNIEISSARRNSDEIWQKQLSTAASSRSERKLFFWLTDFQENQFSSITPSNYKLTCIPISHKERRNIYVDTAFIYSPSFKLNESIKIVFRLKKSVDDKSEKSLISLFQNDQIKQRREINWASKVEYSDTFFIKTVSSDWQYLKLTVSDPNISFDNDFYFCFYVSPKPYVSLISNTSDKRFLVNALKADDNFDIHNFNSLNLSIEEIQKSNLIIVNQFNKIADVDRLRDWLKLNKNLLIILPGDRANEHWNKVFKDLGIQTIQKLHQTDVRIKQFNLQNKLLDDVFTEITDLSDFPVFSSYYQLAGFADRAKEVLISFDNGMPFLLKFSLLGEGNIYIFTAPIESSNSDFVFNPIFAPIMYKLGTVASTYQKNSYFIGDEEVLSIPIKSPSPNEIFKIRGDGANVIPPQRKIGSVLNCSIHGSIHRSGFYSLEDAKGNKEVELALNHMRNESEMDFLSESDIKKVLNYDLVEIDADSMEYLSSVKTFTGVNLWKLWIGLAILFLILEMAMVVFWDKYFSGQK